MIPVPSAARVWIAAGHTDIGAGHRVRAYPGDGWQEPNWEPTIHEPDRSLPSQEIETYEPIPEIDWDSFTPEPIEHERER